MSEKISEKDVLVPADVPKNAKDEYVKNFLEMTHNTGKLMLYAGDQKIEHLNSDFVGDGIHEDDAEPEHLLRIADRANIGVFATQIGLIARYGSDYPNVPFLVKLNSKTNLVKDKDPLNQQLLTVEQVVEFKNNSGLKIFAVGYTIYLGSEYEAQMLTEATQVILEAHKHGLLVVLWIYPRGKAVSDEKDPHLIAGATGVAACLGADFVKINYPKKEGENSAEILKEAIKAAGRTKVICAGGSSTDVGKFMQTLSDQINISGASGNATGRNIHQKSLPKAVAMCNSIYAITVEGKSVEEAMEVYNSK